MTSTTDFLRIVIEAPNDDDLANLWKTITKENIICINIEQLLYYQFNKNTCLYELLGHSEFSEIVKSELKTYLMDLSKVNTDKRLSDLITKISNVAKAKKIGESCAHKIFDKKYNNIFYGQLESIKNVINFKNGYINLETGEFKKRVETDYFIKCLNYDYTNEIDENITNEIIMIFKQICNDDDKMFDFMMSFFSYCLTGETSECKSLFTIGLKASNGKSTGTKIFETCFKEYTRKLTNAFLKENNESVHKEIAELKGIRYAYMEEYPKNCNLNVDLYKDLVDGNALTNKVMYGTTENIQITFKINILSNHIPKFENDKGILRRGLMAELTNCFLDEHEYKKKKGTYLLNKSLLVRFNNDKYKQSFFNILLKYSINYYKNGLLIFDDLRNGFKEICQENDKMASFIESVFIITDDPNDRIYKEHFVLLYNEKYNLRKDWQTLITDVKKCGLIFKSGERTIYNGKSERGVIIGIKERSIDDDDEVINKLYPSIQKKDNQDENEMKLLRKKIEELEFLLKDKDEEIKKLSKPKEEIKQVITAEIKEEINNDNEEKEKAILKDFIKQQRQEQRQEQKTEDKKEVIEKVVKIKKEKKDKKEKKKKEEIDLDKVFEDPILKQFFN